MTLAELEQVKYKKREIRMITDQIAGLYASVGYASDTVQSAAEWPYSKHTVKVAGIDTISAERVDRRVAKLRTRQRDLEASVDRAEDFIDKLTDSQLRQIIVLRYIVGMSWSMTASKVYGYPNGDRARKKVRRYFRKI